MNGENFANEAATDQSVPEQELTATPETEVSEQPEANEDHPERTFTQKELDDILAKRLARESRRIRRQLEQTQQPLAQSYEAEADWTPQQVIEQYESAKQQQALVEQYHEREEAAFEKYDDFQQVAYNPNLPISEEMAIAIQSSEMGPDVLYWLGSNPKEAARIARLSPLMQAREIGKIELRLETDPPAKKTSSAPAPIAPITPKSNGGPSYDTSDPRSVQQMSTSDWIEAERRRQIAKWEKERNIR